MRQRYARLDLIWFGLQWRFGTDVSRASRGYTMSEVPYILASIPTLEKRHGWQQLCPDCNSEWSHNQTHRTVSRSRENLGSGCMGRVRSRVRYLWLCPWRQSSVQRGLRLHRWFGQQCLLAASWPGLDGQSCRIHFAIQELCWQHISYSPRAEKREKKKKKMLCEVPDLPPWRSIIILTPASLAHPIAWSRYPSCPCTYGSPGNGLTAQYPIGMRTWFKPARAIWKKSSLVIQDLQWASRRLNASSCPKTWLKVYSSFTSWLVSHGWKRDGVIHGSRTNHPPKFTARTFWMLKLKLTSLDEWFLKGKWVSQRVFVYKEEWYNTELVHASHIL